MRRPLKHKYNELLQDAAELEAAKDSFQKVKHGNAHAQLQSSQI